MISTDKPRIKRFTSRTTIATNLFENKNFNNNNNNNNLINDKINKQKNLISNIQKNIFFKTKINFEKNDTLASQCSLENATRISENLSDLSRIDIKTILNILYTKFTHSKYYTEASINTLIALNPFKDRPELYSENVMNFYNNLKLDNEQNLPAHIFKHAATAWQIITNQISQKIKKFEIKNQTILVSGDSGSGKTRSINFIIQYYSYITPVTEQSFQIKNILLNTNQILESFGNARTTLNDNSSRFGKYIKLYFCPTKNELVSAKLITYLLEKTRSINTRLSDNVENFNFHVFYQLLFGSSESERKKFYLSNKLLDNYSYLNLNSDNVFDKFDQLKQSFELIELNSEEIFSIISGIAHLNCCHFDEISGLKISRQSTEHLISASKLFKFDLSDLKNYLLIHELTISNCKDDLIKKPCNLNQIKIRKNCLIKLIYNELFKYLVKSINKKLDFLTDDSKNNYIGLLDIYGFESIQNANSLEQLCINYANEKLQKIFIDSYFKLNKFEYEQEFRNEIFQFEYNDNLPLLNLIESSQNSLFCLLNEQSILNSHDHSINQNQILQKLNQTFSKNGLIFEPRLNRKSEFFIKHYAGVVAYKTDCLVTKNSDHVPDDLIKFLSKSKNTFLLDNLLGDCVKKLNVSSHKKLTVLSKFKKNLDTLISNLSKTNILYVRCIKPNIDLKSDCFDFDLVKNQLESCGIISLLNLSQRGFIHIFLYSYFAIKYFPIFFFKDKKTFAECKEYLKQKEYKEITNKIINIINHVDYSCYKLGETKIFLKESLLKILDTNLNKSQNLSALVIQSYWRMYKQRNWYLLVLKSTVKIQTWWLNLKKMRFYGSIDLDSKYSNDILLDSFSSTLSLSKSLYSFISYDNLQVLNSSNIYIQLELVEKKLLIKKQ